MDQIKGIYLLLGTNLGNKQANLKNALQLISSRIGEVLSSSSLYETAAWGFRNQPSFLNMVVKINTQLPPQLLLKKVNEIEEDLGRIRHEKWKERTIDIDILYYDQTILNLPDLVIPHLGIPNRRFTLIPLTEIAPKFIHPILRLTQQELLEACPDHLDVKKLENDQGNS